MTYLKSSDVSVLFFFMIMKETNFNLGLVCVVFLGMDVTPRPEEMHSTCNCRGAYVN